MVMSSKNQYFSYTITNAWNALVTCQNKMAVRLEEYKKASDITHTNEPYPGILGNLSTLDKVWKTVNRTCIQSR